MKITEEIGTHFVTYKYIHMSEFKQFTTVSYNVKSLNFIDVDGDEYTLTAKDSEEQSLIISGNVLIFDLKKFTIVPVPK